MSGNQSRICRFNQRIFISGLIVATPMPMFSTICRNFSSDTRRASSVALRSVMSTITPASPATFPLLSEEGSLVEQKIIVIEYHPVYDNVVAS